MARKITRFNHSFTQQSFMNADSIQYFVKWQKIMTVTSKKWLFGEEPLCRISCQLPDDF